MASYRLAQKIGSGTITFDTPKVRWKTVDDLLNYTYFCPALGCIVVEVKTAADIAGSRFDSTVIVPAAYLFTGKKHQNIRATRFTSLMDVLNSFWEREAEELPVQNVRFVGFRTPVRQTFNPDEQEAACT